MNTFYTQPFTLVYDNDLDAFIPEIWANESVAILIENMVASNMVHRDFENEVAKFGDLVHTRKPAEFTAKRKTKTDDVTIQDASATDIPVPLNQHLHTSFVLKDEDLTKSFQELRTLYLTPAIISLAQALDKITLGQCYQFMANQQGHLGLGADSTVKGYMIDTRKRAEINKQPQADRNLIIGPNTEAFMLSLDTFTEADKVGDDGTALREASLGRKFGYNIFQCQNTPSVDTSIATVASKIDLSGGYAAGTKAIHVDTAGLTDFENLAGCFIKIAGDETIQRVTAEANASTQDIDLTITPGLRHAVADDAVITKYNNALINDSDDYAIGYSKEITVDGYTGVIAVGTLVAFSTDGAPNVAYTGGYYAVIATTETTGNTTGITLDRPLTEQIDDNDFVNLGPAGEMNFAFQKNCLALVVRPLVVVPGGMGAMSAIANFEGMSVRVTVSYEGRGQGILVTCDLLCGVATLDVNRAGLMLC